MATRLQLATYVASATQKKKDAYTFLIQNEQLQANNFEAKGKGFLKAKYEGGPVAPGAIEARKDQEYFRNIAKKAKKEMGPIG